MISVSVVIPTFDRTKSLNECIASLARQTFNDFEIIIICVGNKKSLIDLYRNFPAKFKIRIEEQKENGLVNARNEGWRNAEGKIVCFIDDDVVVSEDWLKEIVNTFDTSEQIGGISGPTIIPKENLDKRDLLLLHTTIKNKKNIFWKILYMFYNYIVMENNALAIGRIFKSGANSVGANFKECIDIPANIEIDYLEACNMSFQKKILEKTGGFNKIYVGIGDWSEPDLAFRIKDLGYKLLFNPKAVLFHKPSQSGVYKKRTYAYDRIKNFIHFYFRCIKPNTIDKAICFGVNLLFINLYTIYKFLQTRNLDWLSGIKGTLCGLGKEICRL